MGLELKINHVQQNFCKEWVLYDVSGVYNAITNSGGWCVTGGAGANLKINNSSITTAGLTITTPSGRVIPLNLKDITTWRLLTPYKSGEAFDTSTDPATLSYTLTEDVIGLIVDGIYKIQYTVSDGTTAVIGAYTVALFGRAESGVFKMVEAAREINLDAHLSYNQFSDLVIIWALYLQMMYSARIASVERFNKILGVIQRTIITYGFDSLI